MNTSIPRFLLGHQGRLDSLLAVLAVKEPASLSSSSSSFSLLKYSACRALIALLPLEHCGREEGEGESLQVAAGGTGG